MAFANQVALPEGDRRYKGNLHSHTTASDGHWTPEEAVRQFRAHGYSFLCLSEHDRYTDRTAQLNTDDFILLPGLEASALLVDGDNPHARRKTHHMHGILGTAAMRRDAPYRFEHDEVLEPVVFRGDWDGVAVAQSVADTLVAHGCLVTYNHPIWSRVEMGDVLGVQGVWAVEVYNYDTVLESETGYDTAFWDAMLRRGEHVNCFASDDNHNGTSLPDAFGGWVVVCAPELTHEAIVSALAQGAYYSSAGPEVINYGICDGRAWIACSPCARVTMVAGGCINAGETRHAPFGQPLTYTEFALRGDETYVRFECVDAQGRRAWTNPLYAE